MSQVTRQISLSVNGAPIGIDYFVQGFMDHVISGMMETLEGAGAIETLQLDIDGDKLKIVHNGKDIPTNPFVTKVVRNTVSGMVSSLKGVDQIKTLSISMKK